ncbi:MAG: redoxin domain-containing protein [Gemmataceae bacterium]
MKHIITVALVALLLAPPVSAAPVADFKLVDANGQPWSLHAKKIKATVVVFLAAECPMSNGYLPALADVAKKYAEKGVQIVGVFPDADATPKQLAAHAKEYKLPFTLLWDESHAAVKALGAKTTPEAFVLDDALTVRYRGRIDDGFSARLKAKPGTARQDLTIALDELLAGKPVSVADTKAFGCPIGDPAKKAAVAGPAVTFHKDVLPVLQAHCQSCHRPGQVGPFALTSYKQAAKWADACLEEVKAKKMPPWKAEKNDILGAGRSLPPEAIATLEKWVEQGLPEGDPRDAPPPVKFTDGWSLGEPDLILEANEDTIVGPNGRDLFRVLVFPTNLPEDKYITAMEVKPGNARVVHHTLQMIDTSGTARRLQADAQKKAKPTDADRGPGYSVSMGWGFLPNPGNMLGGWAPGLLPKRLPDGIGQTLPKGADMCVQFHYHRTGKEEKDRTKIGLYFAKGPIEQKYRSIAATGLFKQMPAGAKNFVVENTWRLTDDVTLYRLVPHMHLLGKDIELRATLPGEKERSLIRIPEWDYNWQEQYELKEPMKLPKGTILKVRATYDNSADNPNNPSSPPKPVHIGEQTTDEMCFVFLGVASKSAIWKLVVPEGPLFKN